MFVWVLGGLLCQNLVFLVVSGRAPVQELHVFGGLGGIAVAILMVLFCVKLGLNQIVIGIALTLQVL